MQHAARHCNANTCSIKKSCRVCRIYSGAASTRTDTDTACTISAAPPGRGAPLPSLATPMHRHHAARDAGCQTAAHGPRTPRTSHDRKPARPMVWTAPPDDPHGHTGRHAGQGVGGGGYAPDSGAVGLDTLAHRLLPPFRICQPELEKSLDIGVKRVVELYRCRTFWYWGDTFRSGARRLWSHALVF
jgi:hypothetical protein